MRVFSIETMSASWEERLRQAFLSAVTRITDRVVIALLEDRLKAGDVESAIRVVGLDPNDFLGLYDTVAAAYGDGGRATVETIPVARDPGGAAVHILFDVRNPRAEEWLTSRAGGLVTEIVDDQRTAIRRALTAGMEAGENPRTVALDLVGRRDGTTGKRVGGIVGLTSGQEQWQRAYAAELTATDPSVLRKAMSRGLRDKRFDRAIMTAIETGQPIPAATRAKMISAYRNRSLKYRADVIARTEAIRALGAAQVEAYEQAIERGQVREEHVVKVPISAHDERVRHDHRLVEQLNAAGVPWRLPYAVPAGMAPQMHAPYDEPMCRCHEIIRVDRFAGLK